MINNDLKNRIKCMVTFEQKARKSAFSKRFEKPYNVEHHLVYLMDNVHYHNIKEIITEYGYPTQKILGKRGMKDFWLLVQHQDHNTKFQKECLKNCDFEEKQKAYLTDRIMTKEEGKQLYGTQFRGDRKTGKLKPFPIKDRKNLDKRRKEAGMESFKEHCKKVLE